MTHAAAATLPASGPLAPSQAQLDTFAAQGFLRWGPLLTADEVAELRDEYDRVFAEAERSGAYRNIAGGDGTNGAPRPDQPQQMLQIMQVCERSLAFRRLVHDQRILEVVRAIIGPSILLFHDQALSKPPRSGGAVAWHQDNGYWRNAPANLISCWLTLDDVVRDNGAMQLARGSHLAPQRHAAASGNDVLLEVPEPPEATVEVVELAAGSCLFHHCQTLHYTAPNRTARPRRAFAIHYMPPGTRDRDGRILRAGWEHPVVSLEL